MLENNIQNPSICLFRFSFGDNVMDEMVDSVDDL